MDNSEKERGDKNGPTWSTNYNGVKNLVEVSKKFKSFLIQISTDAVFPGTNDFSGPYSENDKTQKNEGNINWYGFTKLKAEEIIQRSMSAYAIIRISHPFGNPKSNRDLVKKTIFDIKQGHELFADQLFTPTYLEDLTRAIRKIQLLSAVGIFHVGSTNLVSRLKFDEYLAKKLKMKDELKIGSLKEFISLPGRAPRTRLGGLSTKITQKKLTIVFHTWQNALDKTLRTI